MLLRQVNVFRPFEAKKGEVMKAWANVAQPLADHEEFGRPTFDAKKAQHRFVVLMDSHVKYDAESAKASGICQDHDERIMLLDELLAAYTDTKDQEKSCHDQAKGQAALEQDTNEVDGAYIRQQAMESLGKRKLVDDDVDKSGASGGRLAKIAYTMQEEAKAERELRKEELDFRKFKYEKDQEERYKDREERREERQKDRELALEQTRLQNESMIAIISALKK
ncbi:hypothetical protein DYB32_010852 [Aphanomyces invadans]|uniref:Uncharacterized protein n=1 Tax=Aphanomyces invadans TaxID=157072 RepID=A0A418AEV2_9STRA|nr:hypothetical protein DYB32_010852 [Aphanomyces invadans]